MTDRPYKCSWEGCNKQFMTKGHLKNHQDTHLDIKQFKCDYVGCNKSYSRY